MRSDLQNPMFKAQPAVMTDVFGYMPVGSIPQTLICAEFELAMKTAQYHLRSLAEVGGVEEANARGIVPRVSRTVRRDGERDCVETMQASEDMGSPTCLLRTHETA